jgi:foldase protein PrsA
MIDILRGVTTPTKAVLLAVVLLAATASGCAQTFGTAAAVVNGHRITESDLKAGVTAALAGQQAQGAQPDQVTRQVLFQLIETELLREVAKTRHIAPTQKEIDASLQSVESRFNDVATFRAQLRQAGLTLSGLRDQLESQMIADRLSSSLATTVTQADVADVYKRERAQFEQVKVKHILIAVQGKTTDAIALNKAKDILAQLKAGADFATLAKKFSDDTGSKATGGTIPDWLSVADPQLDQAFAQAAWAAPVGKLTGPVRSAFGYHIIVTLQKRVQPLSEVGPGIKTQLETQSKDRALADFGQSLVARAHILVNPRYGDWDAKTQSIVAHSFFRPAPGETPAPAQSLVLPLPTTTP